MMPHDLPPWYRVYQQTRRRLKAGVFEAITHDLRRLLRDAEGRAPEPSAVILDGRKKPPKRSLPKASFTTMWSIHA
jgi:hypothetical protein